MRRLKTRWVLLVVVLIGLAVSVFGYRAWYRLSLAWREHRVSDLLLACRIYQKEHNDQMPSDLMALRPMYAQLHNVDFLESAIQNIEYAPHGVQGVPSAWGTVVMREKRPDIRGRIVLGFTDGHVELNPW